MTRPALCTSASIFPKRPSTFVPNRGHDCVGYRSISASPVDADARVLDDDRGATLGEQARVGTTEPTPRAGDKRDLPTEIDHERATLAHAEPCSRGSAHRNGVIDRGPEPPW
jgi:hypothetical protein